jgi:hypothetical protein
VDILVFDDPELNTVDHATEGILVVRSQGASSESGGG